ncbi:MAG: HAMP domain-containing histidine kinase [Paenibacillaceae bacterium]|nr:HAMP domain-containing histidine kinase [Paenibacillaceae bacterium]
MSIRKKLVLSYIAMIVIPLVLFGCSIALFISLSGGGFTDGRHNGGSWSSQDGPPWTARGGGAAGDKRFAALAEQAKADPAKLDSGDWQREADRQLAENDALFVVAKQGKALYMSPELQQVQADVADMLAQQPQDGAASATSIELGGRKYAVDSANVTFADRTAGALYRLADTNDASRFFHRFIPFTLLTLLAVLALTNGLLTYAVSRSIIRPLQALQRAAGQIKEGNLDQAVRLGRKDEIGALGDAFEEMRGRLQESVRLRDQYETNRKELLANVSHDLKTPIMAIKGCVEGIRDGVADTEEKRERYMAMIASKADEMDRQIDELFLFSKLDLRRLPFTFAKIDLVRYLRDYTEELELDASRRGVTAAFENATPGGEEGALLVNADGEKLQRALANIAANSLKYMHRPDGRITIRLEERGGEAIVSIRDNGPGIEQAALPHIFERFYRAEQSRNTQTGGSGLGLAIVRQIVAEHGGRVWAESEQGAGTTIYVALPKAASEEETV